METRSIAFFAEACRGEPRSARVSDPVRRVVTDSREAGVGDLFVALRGDRFDGHEFVEEALRRGAVAAVVARDQAERWPGRPRLVVGDTRTAYGAMASAYRAGFVLPVIAVAGSNGKTTTKDLIASLLGGCFETLRSPESFNNEVGVPATLLGIEERHVAAVVEVGTNHPGELAPLLRMAQPKVGVLTQVGEEHLEYFGSLAGVIEEEGWIAEQLPPDGTLILPGAVPGADRIARRGRARVVRVGLEASHDWRILESEGDADGTTFSVRAPSHGLSGEYRVNLLGGHQVINAVLAAAVGAEFGLDRDEIRRGLAACRPARWRMHRWQWDGVEVIDDCYNANLDSTLAALEAVRSFPCAGRRVVVLGGMAELGGHTARAHGVAGRRAAELGIDRLVTVGPVAALSAQAASAAGLAQTVEVADLGEAAEHLRAVLRPGDCLLIKGSRSAHLERLGDLLRERLPLQHAA